MFRVKDKKKSRKGYVSIAAVDPRDGQPWDLLIAHRTIDDIGAKQEPDRVKTLAYLVPHAVQHPTAIFEGLRDEDDNGLCYVSRPPHRYVGRAGHQVPPAPDRVFLVFVSPDRVIYNWRWEPCDPGDMDLPAGHSERFDRRLI